MENIFLLGTASVLLVLLSMIAVACFLYLFSLGSCTHKHPPFIGTNEAVFDEIITAFGPISDTARVYELGSGDGRVILSLAKRHPHARFVGIEKHVWPYVLSRWHGRGISAVSFIYGDMFKVDITGATHVFLYLFPEALEALLPKLTKQLAPGAILVSLDYAFKDKQPVQVRSLEHLRLTLGKKLFIYEF